MLRENIARRHEVFLDGLSTAGFKVACGIPSSAKPGNVMLIWNRRGEQERIADQFEKDGGVVLVAEEGYIRRDRFYSLARSYHNGGGKELVTDSSRVSALEVEVQPWRDLPDGHVLVCPNRFIGPSRALMPSDWAYQTAGKLRKLLPGREVRIRPHPGREKDAPVNGRSLAEDLVGVALCVVWWSTAGIVALLSGVPVIYCAPWWIASAAASCRLADATTPMLGDRDAALRRIANSQFTPDEIASGLPFRGLS